MHPNFFKLLSKQMHLTARKVSKYGVFSGPYFPVFGLNTYSVNLRIQSEYRKIQARNHSVFGLFSRSAINRKWSRNVKNLSKTRVYLIDLVIITKKGQPWNIFYQNTKVWFSQVFSHSDLFTNIFTSIVTGICLRHYTLLFN